VVWRSVLEHLEDLCSFVGQSRRVLKDGGCCIYLFACKFAPFALLNQALPRGVSKRLLDLVFPDKKGILGFPAFYDRCYPSAMRRLPQSNGFEV
jgi:2-polyprenyl-6-hydroxyphenyl methylase/3-demethylubiquinone-9 3-methyltransferase